MSETPDWSNVPGCHEPETDIEREIDTLVGRYMLMEWRTRLPEEHHTDVLRWLRAAEMLDDENLYDEAYARIKDSAERASYPGNERVHFKSDACMRISERRHVAAGHDRRCQADLYSRAHNELGRRLFGHRLREDCNCDEYREED